MVLLEIVSGETGPVVEMPSTDAAAVAPVALAAVERFRTVLPVIVFPPTVTMPPRTRLVVATEGTYALFRFATVLFVIEIVPGLLLLMPVTTCAVELVDAVEALMLFEVVVLPIVLPPIVTAGPMVLTIPVKPWEMVVEEPVTVIEPITLFEMAIVELLDSLVMPELTPPVVV